MRSDTLRVSHHLLFAKREWSMENGKRSEQLRIELRVLRWVGPQLTEELQWEQAREELASGLAPVFVCFFFAMDTNMKYQELRTTFGSLSLSWSCHRNLNFWRPLAPVCSQGRRTRNAARTGIFCILQVLDLMRKNIFIFETNCGHFLLWPLSVGSRVGPG